MAEKSSSPRILVSAKYFSEGHGGAPESILLLARRLRQLGIVIDVVSKLGLSENIGQLQRLPSEKSFDAAASSRSPNLKLYDALLIAGSWNPQAILHALRAKVTGIPIVYAPKGCLCRIDFERLRDLRKVPYFMLVEWLLLAVSKNVLLSSSTEENGMAVPRQLWRRKAVRLPEPFSGPTPTGEVGPRRDPAAPVTFGFLAEISPRKGLLELVDGFVRFRSDHPAQAVRLQIGGRVRRGSEAYAAQIRHRIADSGLAADVQWDGPVALDNRSRFYEEVDFFLCPSRFEVFGLTPLEALWRGTPAAVARNLGVLEYLPADAPVLVFQDLSPATISLALADMSPTATPLLRAQQNARGREIPPLCGRQSALQYSELLLQ